MEIETRFNVGDMVWFMSMNCARSGRICSIRCKVEEDGKPDVEYILGYVGSGSYMQDGELFESKSRLIDYLRNEAEE